nr:MULTISPECIES: acyloxyacyl hydrolase [Pseudomonas]
MLLQVQRFRYLASSNAGIKQPNDGVERYSLHYRMAL